MQLVFIFDATYGTLYFALLELGENGEDAVADWCAENGVQFENTDWGQVKSFAGTIA